ncbi:MAG: PD-(D/E)XK nuclease family protein [Alistipes sp.]
MHGFLRETAEDLYSRYGDDLSSLSILFPSQRARLFFTDALKDIVSRPLWQPRWLTIDDLMSEISGLKAGDRVRLITELYKIYATYHAESFDKFYFWGDMLLSDFDTIDKYRIDADMLFRNLSDIKELEADISYLTPAQLKIVSFWMSLGEERSFSEQKRKFLAVWKTLAPIYHQFCARLTELGLAYTGRVQRVAADKIAQGTAVLQRERHYVFVGFNALSECEKRLFKWLAATGADFYWDYDDYYKENPAQEAGLFIRENLSLFPSNSTVGHDNMRKPKDLEVISTTSNAVQCKYVATLLGEYARAGKLDKETAIVLTDENLLLPLLYALPKEIGKVNVTMGYPLKQSLAYTFIERLIELQNHRRKHRGLEAFYHVDVTGILSHPYVAECDAPLIGKIQADLLRERCISVDAARLQGNELLAKIFYSTTDWLSLSDYLLEVIAAVAHLPYEGDDSRQRVEFLAVLAEHISKLHNSLVTCDLTINTSIYTSLLRRHLQTLRIPFEGEPLEGVQVMGILETRNLDFKNVIILSMNDANFPGNFDSRASFIPYNLRAAYGLPTPEHHEGVYAYYFYRLIQRAERVAMLYCAHADEKSTGEPSRYIYQLAYESGFKLQRTEVGVDVNLIENEPITVPKTDAVWAKLQGFLSLEDPVRLSPTAFSRYAVCPLRFYFASVARLKTTDEITDEVDNPMFGTILHAAMQSLYERIKNEAHPAQILAAMIRAGEVERAVEVAINTVYLHDETAQTADYSGSVLLVKDIVIKYIRGGVMAYDQAHDAFCVEGLEEPVACDFVFDGKRQVHFAGIADRIDHLDDGLLRVVDYKTGRKQLEFRGLSALFDGEARHTLGNILQTLLYSMMLYHTRKIDTVPALFYVRGMNKADYSPQLIDKELHETGVTYVAYRTPFEEMLATKLCELFDPTLPFQQCEDNKPCIYCDYREICRR